MTNFEDGPLADLQKDVGEGQEEPIEGPQGSPGRPEPREPRPPQGGGGGGRNCLLFGLIGCLVVFLLLVVLIVVALYAGQSWISGMVDEYTDTEPAQMPEVDLTQEEMDAVSQRVEAFGEAVEAGEPVEPLRLTAGELNALIVNSDVWRELGGDAYVQIEDNQITAEVSIPLDEFGWEMFQGRYLNGSATLTMSFEDGRLLVFAEDFSVKGEALPEEFRQQLRAQNLAEDVNEDREFMETFKGIESIVVEDDVLVVTPKNTPSAQGEEPSAEDAEQAPEQEVGGQPAETASQEAEATAAP